MQRIFSIIMIWCVCGAKAASFHSDVFSSDMLSQIKRVLTVMDLFESNALATDAFTEQFYGYMGQVFDIVQTALQYEVPDAVGVLPSSFNKWEQNYRLPCDRLQKALLQNKELKLPGPLLPGWELAVSLRQLTKVCSAIGQIQLFRVALNQNPWLSPIFPNFEGEVAKHVCEITQTPPMQFLIDYVAKQKNKPDALQEVVGVEIWRDQKITVHLSSVLWGLLRALTCEDVKDGTRLATCIKTVQEVEWKKKFGRFVAYAQVDRVLPGIVYLWRAEAKDVGSYWAERELYVAQQYIREVRPEEGVEWLDYTFAKSEDLKNLSALSLTKIFSVMDALAPIYNQREDANHEIILLLLADQARSYTQNLQRKDFIKEHLPRITKSVGQFATLSLEQSKKIIVAFSAPHLEEDCSEIAAMMQDVYFEM